MATSADKLQDIIYLICNEYKLPQDRVKTLLCSKNLLPKKLIKQDDAPNKTTSKTPSYFASKQAKELADKMDLNIDSFNGTAKNGRYSLKDIQFMLSSNKTTKHITPTAKALLEQTDFDIGHIVGTGNNGKIILKDVEKYISDSDSSKSDKKSKKQPQKKQLVESDSDSSSDTDSECN
jgi:pyruvate/2-oxoglutarate dehydrogenase complex dihydrolipoamide acyltransferase (E2) component